MISQMLNKNYMLGLRKITGFLSICLVSCKGSSPIVDKKVAQYPVKVAVDLNAVIRDIPRGVFGTNIEWFNHGNGLVDSKTGAIKFEFAERAKEQNISLIRFPGGTFSDYYHWRDGIGPQKKRPFKPHFTDPGQSKNDFGTPEVARFAEAAGSDLLITVNAGTGTAKEAAEWVSYCNDKTHALRAKDGFKSPLGVKYWEVGNELYLPGNPGEIKVGVEPDVYAKRYKEYAKAMKKADDSIELLAISSANSTRMPLPHEDWLEVLLKEAAPEIDFVAIHNAYFPMIFLEKKLDVKTVYQSLWASPEAIKANLGEVDQLISKYDKNRRIGLAITEWGTLFSFDPEWIDHVQTLGSAIYVARVLQVFLSDPRVEIANYFKFTDNVFMGWVDHYGRPKVPATAFEMMSTLVGKQLIEAQVTDSPTYSVKALGVAKAEKGIEEITAIASKSDDKVYINLINRSWDQIHQVDLDLKGLKPQFREATIHLLSSDGVTDHNGTKPIPEFKSRMTMPERSVMSQAAPLKVMQYEQSLEDRLVLPPFSILTVEISL